MMLTFLEWILTLPALTQDRSAAELEMHCGDTEKQGVMACI